MVPPLEHTPGLDPQAARLALVAELRRQWPLARRVDVWAVLTALDRAGLAPVTRHDSASTFHPSDMFYSTCNDGHALTVITTFLGIAGPGSPLPGFAVEAIQDAPQLRLLFSLLERRLIEHLHRAIRRCAYPSACAPDRNDPGSLRLVDHVARAVAAPELPPRAWLRLLAHSPARLRNAAGLGAALTRMFAGDLGDAVVSLIECVPRTGEIPESARARLGRPTVTLGAGFVLGDSAPDADGWFRVRVGPLAPTRARPFLRGGDALRRLFTTVAALAGPLLRFDVELVLAPGAAPRMRLGDPVPRLGVDTWAIHLHRGLITVRHDDPG